MMETTRIGIRLESVRISGLLSFGSDSPPIALGALNVLIGPNASGKSNLIEALSLLRAAPRDILVPIREGGGVLEWMWKGSPRCPEARIAATLCYHGRSNPLSYQFAFSAVSGRFELIDESLTTLDPFEGKTDPYIYYAYQNGNPVLNTRTLSDEEGLRRNLKREDIEQNQSVLSQRKDPDLYPELTEVGRYLASIRLYRNWNTGRRTAPRLPQQVDLPEDFLLEDGSNLGLVLNDLQHRGDTSAEILDYLKSLYPEVSSVTTKVHGGTIQVFFHEKGLSSPIPATRLSDGTLRFLSLLAILCHPDPPPLVCIEEPEIGLHPDAIPAIGKAMVAASQRTQLIVTTHSDVLVDTLTDQPESVQVVERASSGTHVHRLEADRLKDWLDRYYLGELWRKGELGGTRW
jgi:predicted ATPase